MDEVFIPIPIDEVTEAEEQPSLTYRLDLDNGRIVGKVDGLEAVNHPVSSALSTTTSTAVKWRRQLSQRTQARNTSRQ